MFERRFKPGQFLGNHLARAQSIAIAFHYFRGCVEDRLIRALIRYRSSFLPEQRATATDDFPKRSSLTRETGVVEDNIAAADVTAEALSSIETCIRSLASRTRSTSVSTIFLESTLNEYWTLLNREPSGNSRRMRTQSAAETAPAGSGCIPGMGVFGSSVERPRATSKSVANAGLAGTLARAEDNSFCSSAEGAQTLRTLTLTLGSWAEARATISKAGAINILRRNTAKLYQGRQIESDAAFRGQLLGLSNVKQTSTDPPASLKNHARYGTNQPL